MAFLENFSSACWHRLPALASGALLAALLLLPRPLFASHPDKNSDRPKLPYNMMGLQQDDLDAYDSKAEPVADATAALMSVNVSGWQLIRKYYPKLGASGDSVEQRVDPEDPMDSRFFAGYVNEDAALSPLPLLCIVGSLSATQLSGKLQALHDAVAPAMNLEDYSAWKLDDLRKAVSDITRPAKTTQGVKYRTPKSNLSFVQAVRLYAMTLALIRMETKWAGKTDSPAPDMLDFTNRLRRQLPREIPEGKPTAMFLYRPGVFNHPLSKNEFEERADVVVMTRRGSSVAVEQFPVYLTEDQKEWSPSWIEPADEQYDATLMARKYEHDWTRLDGPFLWFRGDQFDGQVIYRATVRLHPDDIVIEAERIIENRGAVKRAQRPRDYDAAFMTAFRPGVDTPAGPVDAFTVDPPRLQDQVSTLKRLGPYFSNSFRAWCAYGISESGRAPDGKTWVSVPPEEPRPGAPNATAPAAISASAATTKAHQ